MQWYLEDPDEAARVRAELARWQERGGSPLAVLVAHMDEQDELARALAEANDYAITERGETEIREGEAWGP